MLCNAVVWASAKSSPDLWKSSLHHKYVGLLMYLLHRSNQHMFKFFMVVNIAYNSGPVRTTGFNVMWLWTSSHGSRVPYGNKYIIHRDAIIYTKCVLWEQSWNFTCYQYQGKDGVVHTHLPPLGSAAFPLECRTKRSTPTDGHSLCW